ncbi:MAG: hypothetical protein IPH82_05990 [Chloroflexi bacterium]|nr:hypothetical protein [Chloroflexota bacterium]
MPEAAKLQGQEVVCFLEHGASGYLWRGQLIGHAFAGSGNVVMGSVGVTDQWGPYPYASTV